MPSPEKTRWKIRNYPAARRAKVQLGYIIKMSTTFNAENCPMNNSFQLNILKMGTTLVLKIARIYTNY